jgi:predicted anti-sigma-YlaC factor YlaD
MRLDRELACRDVVDLVTAYLEYAMTPTDCERFEEHLVFCEGCGTYLEQMRATVAAAGRLAPVSLPPELERRLLEAFREWSRA